MNPHESMNYAAPAQTGVVPNGWYIPAWADPEKRRQRELRSAASRISLAVLLTQPISLVFSMLAMTLLTLCGVNFLFPAADTIAGFPPAAYYFLTALISIVSMVVPFCVLLALQKKSLADTIMVEKNGAAQGFLIAVAGAFICIVMNIPANLISSLLEGLGLNGAANTESMVAYSLPDLIALWMAVVVVAPLAEEFAFRGVTVALMRRWGDWCAVVFSAIIFAMAHFSFQAMPVVLVGGFIMALLYVRTRNIWINILVHFINNLLATLPIVVDFFFGEQAAAAVDSVSFIGICVAGIAAIGILGFRHFGGHPVFKTQMQRGEPVRAKWLHLFVNPGFLVYFAVFIGLAVWMMFNVV